MPMEDESIRQPVVAYFSFIQNNLAQLAGGNASQVMREAEQRHMQIMNQVFVGMRNEMAKRMKGTKNGNRGFRMLTLLQ